MEKNKNIVRTIVGVLILILLVGGVTYAYFAWKSNNTNITGTSGCFDINYDKGQDIGSTDSPYGLKSTCTYSEGASASVTMNIDSACTTTGVASINLITNNFTLYDSTDAFSRGENVLKYQVVKVNGANEEEIEGCSGYITNSSTKSLCEVDLSYTATTYKVYLYLDCNTVTTSYIGASYSGYIQTVATQTVS